MIVQINRDDGSSALIRLPNREEVVVPPILPCKVHAWAVRKTRAILHRTSAVEHRLDLVRPVWGLGSSTAGVISDELAQRFARVHSETVDELLEALATLGPVQ